MNEQQARDLLQLIATDPAFRAQLEQDPVNVLAQWGCTIEPSQVPPEGIKLPSNENILSAIDDLAERTVSSECIIFFKL